MATNPALRLQSIHKSYTQADATLAVLNDVSLQIAAGELVALVGESGSGKTTLLQIAGGLDLPDAGSVQWLGTPIETMNDQTRTRQRGAQLGFVYQYHHLLPEFSALENVMLPQQLRGVATADARARATELLARLGVEHRASHMPAQLSGGQQQRVAIARALANRPALLLADEPTGNLDPATAHDVFALLLELAKEEGMAALVATHNLELASRMHRTVRMRGGVIGDA